MNEIPHANDNLWTKAQFRTYVLDRLETAARIERQRPLTFQERRARRMLIELLERHG